MQQDSKVTRPEVVPVVRLKASPKPKTEIGDGGTGFVPVVRLHATRQG